jgi:glutathione synthase/RimK-type ligase-like ATP-grasp enzyme
MDPLGYLKVVNDVLAAGTFDVLLPTHEQAWLFAIGRCRLDRGVRVAIASADAFSRVQSKIEFARLLDEAGLPQPRWRVVEGPGELADWPTPFYLKTSFSTAGTGVRRVTNSRDATPMWESLRSAGGGGPVMVQAAADGEYAQVQALFDRGRLVAVHTSMQTAVGIGPSAAGRVGSITRSHAATWPFSVID